MHSALHGQGFGFWHGLFSQSSSRQHWGCTAFGLQLYATQTCSIGQSESVRQQPVGNVQLFATCESGGHSHAPPIHLGSFTEAGEQCSQQIGGSLPAHVLLPPAPLLLALLLLALLPPPLPPAPLLLLLPPPGPTMPLLFPVPPSPAPAPPSPPVPGGGW